MRSRPAILALIGILAAGCTTNQAGQAAPVGTSDSTTQSPATSSGSATSTVSIPPRPKELKLDGIDPCTLFTDPQLAPFKLDRKRKRIAQDKQYQGMLGCALDSSAPPFEHVSVTAATNEGIEAWLTGQRNVEAKLSSVEGFAVADYWFRGAHDRQTSGCSTAVDVAKGQMLMLNVENDTRRSFTLDQLCQRAEQLVGLAIQTLQTLR